MWSAKRQFLSKTHEKRTNNNRINKIKLLFKVADKNKKRVGPFYKGIRLPTY